MRLYLVSYAAGAKVETAHVQAEGWHLLPQGELALTRTEREGASTIVRKVEVFREWLRITDLTSELEEDRLADEEVKRAAEAEGEEPLRLAVKGCAGCGDDHLIFFYRLPPPASPRLRAGLCLASERIVYMRELEEGEALSLEAPAEEALRE